VFLGDSAKQGIEIGALARVEAGCRLVQTEQRRFGAHGARNLEAALRSDAFYVGALGSRKTQAARRERLRAQGFSDPALSRIHGPVGLPIGARSPGEIAVSILSQIVGALRGAPGSERAGA